MSDPWISWHFMAKGPQKYTDEQLAFAVANSPNMRQVLISLGLAARGGNYETVRQGIAFLGIDASHLGRWSRGVVAARSDQEILDAVKASRSFAQALKKLGLRPGRTPSTLKRRIELLGVDTSHLTGMAWRRGSGVPVTPAFPLDKVLVVGRLTPMSKLKQRFLKQASRSASARYAVGIPGMASRFPSNSTTSTADETTIAWATFALFALIVMLRLRPTEGGTSERRAPILNAARVAEMGDADRLKPGRPARGMWVRIPPRARTESTRMPAAAASSRCGRTSRSSSRSS